MPSPNTTSAGFPEAIAAATAFRIAGPESVAALGAAPKSATFKVSRLAGAARVPAVADMAQQSANSTI